MYETIKTLLGEQLIDIFFDDSGISSSKANAKKNSNTNIAAGKLEKFDRTDVHLNRLSIISDKGENKKETIPSKLSPEDFSDLEAIATLFGENAILGHGIALLQKMIETVQKMPDLEIAAKFNLENTVPMPSKAPSPRTAIRGGNVDRALDFDRIEDIIFVCRDEVLSRLEPGFIFRALRKESRAAVLGNQLTKKDCFLKIISKAQDKPATTENSAFAVIVREQIVAYSPEERKVFEDLYKSLYDEYTAIQSEVNGFKKILKDTIRQVQLEFENAYAEEYKKYSNEVEKYRMEEARILGEVNKIRTKAMQELSALKIRLG